MTARKSLYAVFQSARLAVRQKLEMRLRAVEIDDWLRFVLLGLGFEDIDAVDSGFAGDEVCGGIELSHRALIRIMNHTRLI